MTIIPPSNIELYRRAAELSRIGNRAVKAAQEESRRLGVPNVYSRNGVLYDDQPVVTYEQESISHNEC